MEILTNLLKNYQDLETFVVRNSRRGQTRAEYFNTNNYVVGTYHKASLWSDTVGDGLDPAVRQEDAVLPGHLVPVTLLLLVEVIANIILDSISISATIR